MIYIIEPGAFNGLQSLKRLYLNENQISCLKPEVWEGLSVLEWLELKNNRICELEPNQWVELGSLTHLELMNNLINDVPVGVWNGLSNLERLTLSGNKLREIRGDMWQGLDSLTHLSLSNCDIASLSPGAFQPLHKLYKLVLDRNRLSALEGGIWEGLTSLGQIWLNGNQLTIVQPDMWTGLGDTLRWLTMEQNRLHTVTPGAFHTLNNLTLLSVLNNSLTEVRGDMWRGLTSVKQLYLSLNPVRELPDDAFSGERLRNLERLYLTGLNLTTLPSGVFSELTSLKLLKLRFNNLTTLNPGILMWANYKLENIRNQWRIQDFSEGRNPRCSDANLLWGRCHSTITSNDRPFACPIIYTDKNSQFHFVHRHLNNISCLLAQMSLTRRLLPRGWSWDWTGTPWCAAVTCAGWRRPRWAGGWSSTWTRSRDAPTYRTPSGRTLNSIATSRAECLLHRPD